MTRPTVETRPDRTALAAGIDAAIVVAFVAIGRRNHDEDPGLLGVFATAAPFLVGLALAWFVARAWRAPTAVRTGLVVWPLTVAIGMLVRRLLGDGTAVSFIVVATIFLGLFLVGWRVAATRLDRG